jgi:alanine racemase
MKYQSYFISQLTEIEELTKIISQRAYVTINHEALANNVRQIKAILAPQTQFMAVIKADAYGHGAIPVAETVLQNGCDSLAIATLGEGIELRKAGIEAPILILGAINTPEEVKAISAWQLQPTICHPKQALVFSETLSEIKETLPVHLKLDTGMSRLGTCWQDVLEFYQLVEQLPYLKIASIYSHLATADDPDPTIMEEQQQRFNRAIASLKFSGFKLPQLHLANSAATLTNSKLHYDLVRVGLALYGVYPSSHLQTRIELQPVLQVKAKVTQVKTIPPHTGVSYGHTFTSDRSLRLAVVGIGYADGVPRLLSNKMKVLIKGKFASQIGNITMDQLMIDITHIPHVEVGEIVTLLGKDGNLEITADDWANQIGSISWEILCGFKHRLPRVKVTTN